MPIALLRQDPDEATTSIGAGLARVLLQRAVVDKNHNALVEVLDRIEGKAVKGAANKTSNSHISDQLDQSLEDLNSLASTSEPHNG